MKTQTKRLLALLLGTVIVFTSVGCTFGSVNSDMDNEEEEESEETDNSSGYDKTTYAFESSVPVEAIDAVKKYSASILEPDFEKANLYLAADSVFSQTELENYRQSRTDEGIVSNFKRFVFEAYNEVCYNRCYYDDMDFGFSAGDAGKFLLDKYNKAAVKAWFEITDCKYVNDSRYEFTVSYNNTEKYGVYTTDNVTFVDIRNKTGNAISYVEEVFGEVYSEELTDQQLFEAVCLAVFEDAAACNKTIETTFNNSSRTVYAVKDGSSWKVSTEPYSGEETAAPEEETEEETEDETEIVAEPEDEEAAETPEGEEDAAESTYTVIATYQCGDNVHADIVNDNGELWLELYGTGAMWDYESLDDLYVPWKEYRYEIDYIDVADGITYIGEDAFLSHTAAYGIYIPTSVLEIGNYAFMSTHALEEIYYTGTAEDWSCIDIGQGNYNLTDKVVYNW